MASIACAVSILKTVFSAVVLLAPAVLSLPSLQVEHRRREPALTIMAAAFSPLAVAGYALLTIVMSYSLICLYRFLKPRLSPSATRFALPQPVSTGRTSSFSLYSPFALFRARQKPIAAKATSTWSRWPPISSIFRRLTRPSSPLHLAGTEQLLPIAMPDSPSAYTHSLIDLPIISTPSPGVQPTKRQSHGFEKPMRQLLKAASMDPLPSYRPLTPIQVMVPVPVHITSNPPPSTPPPLTPTSLPGITDSDIPLIPITPPKHRYTPNADSTMRSDSSGLPTPSLTGKFPAISVSPFNPTTPSSSNHRVGGGGPRPISPSPTGNGLVLSSRNLSSLSLSPRSLAMQQHKRSKSLGGVAVKRISLPQFNFDGIVAQGEDLQEDATVEKVRALSAPSCRVEEKPANGQKSNLPSEPLSPSPLTADSDSPPSSAPLETPRSISNASYSSDIARHSETEPLLPRPISLVDFDMDVDSPSIDGMVLGDYVKWEPPAWSVDLGDEQPVAVARILEDFDDDMTGVAADNAYESATVKSVGLIGMKMGEERLIELEDVEKRSSVETKCQSAWDWDEDVEGQTNGWEMEVNDEKENVCGWPMKDEQVVSDNVEESVATGGAAGLVKEVSSDVLEVEPDLAREAAVEYPDPDLLPLPETADVSPPAISICTQDAVLCKDWDSECDSVLSSSIERATPISLGQTPTPPASPPREPRVLNLPKANKSLQDQTLKTSPVAEYPAVDQEDDIISISVDMPSPPPPFVEIQGEEAHAQDKIVVLLDKPLVSSPASISSGLPEEADCEVTFSFESDGDEVQNGSGDEVEVEVVPPSPSGWVAGWDYGSDGEELDQEEELEKEVDIQALMHFRGRDEGWVRETSEDVGADVSGLPHAGDAQTPEEELPVVHAVPEPKLALESPFVSQEPASPSALETTHETAIPIQPPGAVPSAPALQPSASLPGSFPVVTASPAQETKSESVQNDTLSSSQPQIRRRTRTPLEEAIARTRSPLEVALAMQLRPGLGVGADPAWMVRFMMVMWGWMFGLVLVPSAVEA